MDARAGPTPGGQSLKLTPCPCAGLNRILLWHQSFQDRISLCWFILKSLKRWEGERQEGVGPRGEGRKEGGPPSSRAEGRGGHSG